MSISGLCFDSISSGGIMLFVWCWRSFCQAAFDEPLDEGFWEDSLGRIKDFTLPRDMMFAQYARWSDNDQ